MIYIALDEILVKSCMLWLEIKMTRGSPCGSSTNHGIERFNRSFEQRIGWAWWRTPIRQSGVDCYILVLEIQHSSALCLG